MFLQQLTPTRVSPLFAGFQRIFNPFYVSLNGIVRKFLDGTIFFEIKSQMVNEAVQVRCHFLYAQV